MNIVLIIKNPSEPSIKLVMFNMYTHNNKQMIIDNFNGKSNKYNGTEVNEK